MTEPLPKGQKVMLQSLLANHTLNDEEAQTLLDSVDEEAMGATSLNQCFESINRQLTKGFGLEIVSMMNKGKKIHAVINQHADDVAKNSFSSRLDPHARAFVRQVLEVLSTDGPSARSTLINLRSELKEPLRMDLETAERHVEMLLEEEYLFFEEGTGENRRDSMSAKIKLGPRAFLELMHLLTDLGFPQEELPQMFFYR
jgi:hypothetical protein